MELTKEQGLFQAVVQKAWEDSEFKAALVSDPQAAIENLIGKSIKVPDGKQLIVTDQTDHSTFFINIPAKPSLEDMELTDEQLEIVAGGGDPTKPILQNAINNTDPLSELGDI